MEIFPGALDPFATAVDLSSGPPISTIALPHFLCQPAQSAIPAAICSGGVFAIISETEMPLSAPSDWYKTRYLFMAAQPIILFRSIPERAMNCFRELFKAAAESASLLQWDLPPSPERSAALPRPAAAQRP